MTDMGFPGMDEARRPEGAVPPPAPAAAVPKPKPLASAGTEAAGGGVGDVRDDLKAFLDYKRMEAGLDVPQTITFVRADGTEYSKAVRSRPLGVQLMIDRELLRLAGVYDDSGRADRKATRKAVEIFKRLKDGDEAAAEAVADEVRNLQMNAADTFYAERVEAYVRIIQLLLAPIGAPPDLSNPVVSRDEVLYCLPGEEGVKAIESYYLRDRMPWRAREKKILS